MNSVAQAAPAPVSREDVVPLREGARRLGMGLRAFSAWCLKLGIIRDVAGRRRVVWGDVVDAVRGEIKAPSRAPVVQARDVLPTTKITPRRLEGRHARND